VAYFLGLDSSTQSLTALVIDSDQKKVVLDESVNFGRDLPQYRSPHGVLPNSDPRVCHSDPLMWVEAVDLLLSRVRAKGFDWSTVAGISGAGQQHGSVYLNTSLESAGRWTPDRPLVDQVRPLLSYATSPMWMDSSTARECQEIADAAGGRATVLSRSGSHPIERFTGPQIRKIYKTDPAAYERTREIHLVSSFMASLLSGTSAAIDLGDGAGMNLLDLAHARWDRALLDATAPGLADKLRPPVASVTRIGSIAEYFVARYGFAPGTPVIAFTGDNPSSLVGMAAIEPGTRLVSLGTSDTVFAAMAAPHTDPNGYGHVFGNPAGGFMSLICFTNGSLARENVAQRFGLDWPAFAKAIAAKRPGNDDNLMLPFFTTETAPRLLTPGVELFGSPDFVAWKSPEHSARAVVEAQALSMRKHSDWIGHAPKKLVLTGGASRNAGIQRVIADVFQTPVRVLKVANASALGGALRAAQALGNRSWNELFAAFVALDPNVNVEPDSSARSAYERLGRLFDEKLSQRLGRERSAHER
jgi:xylulokinase